jgi:hypothetical protein
MINLKLPSCRESNGSGAARWDGPEYRPTAKVYDNRPERTAPHDPRSNTPKPPTTALSMFRSPRPLPRVYLGNGVSGGFHQ